MKEAWLTVVGYEDLYTVSTFGRVRNLTRGEDLAGGPNAGGYPQVKLYRDGVDTVKLIHWLMAEAFLGPNPDGARIVHLNGGKADNRLGNLRYQITDARKAQAAYQAYLRQEKAPAR